MHTVLLAACEDMLHTRLRGIGMLCDMWGDSSSCNVHRAMCVPLWPAPTVPCLLTPRTLLPTCLAHTCKPPQSDALVKQHIQTIKRNGQTQWVACWQTGEQMLFKGQKRPQDGKR